MALMGQVSSEINLDPSNGGLRCNLSNYIRQRSLYEKGDHHCNLRAIVITILDQTQEV